MKLAAASPQRCGSSSWARPGTGEARRPGRRGRRGQGARRRGGRAGGAGRGGRRRAGAERCSPGRGAEDELGKGSPGPAAPHARRSMPRTRARKWRARGDGEGGGHRGPAGCASFDPEVELQARRLLIGSRQDGTNTRGAPGGHARRLQGGRRGQGRRALRGGLRVGRPCAGSRRPAGACDDLSNRLEGERETEAPEAPPFCLPSGRPSVHTRPARLLRCLSVFDLPPYFLGDQLSGFP